MSRFILWGLEVVNGHTPHLFMVFLTFLNPMEDIFSFSQLMRCLRDLWAVGNTEQPRFAADMDIDELCDLD